MLFVPGVERADVAGTGAETDAAGAEAGRHDRLNPVIGDLRGAADDGDRGDCAAEINGVVAVTGDHRVQRPGQGDAVGAVAQVDRVQPDAAGDGIAAR